MLSHLWLHFQGTDSVSFHPPRLLMLHVIWLLLNFWLPAAPACCLSSPSLAAQGAPIAGANIFVACRKKLLFHELDSFIICNSFRLPFLVVLLTPFVIIALPLLCCCYCCWWCLSAFLSSVSLSVCVVSRKWKLKVQTWKCFCLLHMAEIFGKLSRLSRFSRFSVSLAFFLDFVLLHLLLVEGAGQYCWGVAEIIWYLFRFLWELQHCFSLAKGIL